MQRSLGVLTLVLLVVAAMPLAGCGGKRVNAAPAIKLTPDDVAYRNAFILNFTVQKGIEEPEGPLAAAQGSLIAYLKKSGAYMVVDNGSKASNADSTVIVKAHITSLRIVSGSARFWGGAFAGGSDMKAQVTLVNASTGATIAEKVVDSSTNAMGAAYSGGQSDRDLPLFIGEAIGQFVLQSTMKDKGKAVPANQY
jgi:hypothetical protein